MKKRTAGNESPIITPQKMNLSLFSIFAVLDG